MFVIIGYITVLVTVFGAFAAHGGNLAVMWQPSEYVIIGGALIGGLLASAPMSLLKVFMKQAVHAITGKPLTKEEFNEVLLLLYELLKTAKGNLLGLEAHVENPEGSEIFKRYPGVLKDHHAIEFICDTLKVQISSPVSPYDLEDLMNADLEVGHSIDAQGPIIMNRLAGALPGLGIVAAVLGVVYTMSKLTEGKEVIGASVGAALVGTLLGVLGAYGFIEPLAAKMEAANNDHAKKFDIIKAALLAFAKDASPKVCIEFARRSIPPEVRPSFEEVDSATTNVGKAA